MPSPVYNLKALQRRRETGENTLAAMRASARVVLGNCLLLVFDAVVQSA